MVLWDKTHFRVQGLEWHILEKYEYIISVPAYLVRLRFVALCHVIEMFVIVYYSP